MEVEANAMHPGQCCGNSRFPTERGVIIRRAFSILHPLMCLVFMIVGLGANKSGAYPENNANCTYSSYRVSVNAFCGIYFVLFFLSCVYHGVIIVMRVQWKGVIANNFHFFVRAVIFGDIIDMCSRIGAIMGSFYLVNLLYYGNCLDSIQSSAHTAISVAMWGTYGSMWGGVIHMMISIVVESFFFAGRAMGEKSYAGGMSYDTMNK